MFFLWFLSFKLGAFTWQLNDDHSELFFSIEYLNVSEVTGRFKNLSGATELDEKGAPRSIEIVIDASSVDTGNGMRDGHLKSAEFFQTKSHPFFYFTSSRFERIDPKNFKAFGDLVIKNEKKPITVSFNLSDEVMDTWGYKSRFARFTANLKRSDFKLNWNKTLLNKKFLVGDEVKLWGTFQLQPRQGITPQSKHKIPDTYYIRAREKFNRGEATQIPKFREVPETLHLRQTNQIREKSKSQVEKGRALETHSLRSTTWWVALFTLGFLGFISVILIGIKVKLFLSDYLSKKYVENGFLGHTADLVVIILVAMYSVAFWIVGWGL